MNLSILRIIVAAALLPAAAASPVPAGARGDSRPGGRTPEREVRAVWITTVAGLDWPADKDPREQKSSLLGIVEKLSISNFNTIFFQVRGRGDALYRSELEPWSEVLTGTPGKDPGWDPLAFLLEEAHRRGMEVHAWFNTYLVKGGKGPPPPTTPAHVLGAHPGWGRLYEDRWWLDPGEPGVEAYLLGAAVEIVRRYDVDGLHLDYLRYPGRAYDDDGTYQRYGKGAPRDAWRRANITRFLGRVRGELLRLRPGVKLGVTPIGIYRNPHGVRGLESYADVFQDTYSWIERGLVDYVVPQLYWPIGGGNGDPDFAALAAEWREQAAGCHLYLGIGSYKDEVLSQSERIVGVARASGAEGEAFFRFASIEPALPLDAFRRKVLPPAMPWKDSIPPAPPAGLEVSREGRLTRLAWTSPRGDEAGGHYAVYRMTGDPGGGVTDEQLMAVLPPEVLSITDSAAPPGTGTWYAVTRVDRAWNESVAVTGAGAAAAPGAPSPPARESPEATAGTITMGTPWLERRSGKLFVPFTLGAGGTVDLSVIPPGQSGEAGSFTGPAGAGGNVVAIDVAGLAPGAYRARLAAGGETVEREFRVRR